MSLLGSDADGVAGTEADVTLGFDGISTIIGNGGTLTGDNVDTFWNITGNNSGTFGTTLALIGTNTFNNFSIVGGTANDTFVFQNGAGQITGGIDGGTGTNTLTGSLGNDAFVITGANTVTVTPAVSGLATNLTNITNIDGTNATDDGTTTVGDTGADTFAINASWGGGLNGSGGDDTFTFADTFTVNGTVTGGAGTDIINWNAYTTARNIVLTASVADGFSGTEASITGGFVTINDVRGSTAGGQVDTLTGLDGVTSTWTVNGGGTQYSNNTGLHTLAFSDFEDLTGGSGIDNFNITGAHTGNLAGGGGADVFDVGATLTGSIDGEAGVDVLQGTAIDAVTLTGSDADGFAGTEADVTLGFDGIGTITGNGGTLTGRNVASNWLLDGTPTYNDGANTLNFTGFANLQGGTNTDTFTITAASTFNLLGGAGVDTFDVDATLTGLLMVKPGLMCFKVQQLMLLRYLVSDADGFAGTEADVTLGFDGIGTITGNGGTLTGRDVASNWLLDGTPTYNDGTNTLNFTGFANLQGGTNTDTFTITAASTFNLLGGAGVDTFDVDATLTGSIDGEAGVDVLQGTAIDAVTLTGSDADGFAGTEADVTLGFDGIGTITGNGGTLTGRDVASNWLLDGTPTYNDGTNTLNFTGFANLQGGTNTDTFTITAASTFNLLGGAGDDDFDVFATLTGNLLGGAGADDFDVDVKLTGLVDGQAGADILQGSLITTVELTGSDADGYAGTEADITGDFDGIQVLIGTNASLTGENVASTFSITAANSGTYAGSRGTLTFSGIQNVIGGTAADTVRFTNAGSLTGAVSGGAGTNTLVGDDDGNDFTVTGANIGNLPVRRQAGVILPI